ncbi:MAG: hypothetical protein FWF53_09150 [Candidatus Azobacteroides sp.]|nr:hypothetical protein [Candidatus Azobacteroides sp.]
MNIEYPELAFAFNPIIITCNEINSVSEIVSLTYYNGINGISLIKPVVDGKVEFNVQQLALSMFDRNDFRKVLENDTVLKRKFFTSISYDAYEYFADIDVIFGALQIGEMYNRSKTLTWFKNLPFTFPLFLQNARNFVCEIDGGPPFNWRNIAIGKHNLIPDVNANEKAVFYIDTKNITLELTEYNVSVDYNQATKTIGVITNGSGFTVENVPSWITSQISGSNIIFNISESDIENARNVDIIVRSTDDPDVFATLHINQDGAWLSQFIFDVVTTSSDEYVERIVNLGAIESGEALFDYGDGTDVEVKTVLQSTPVNTTDQAGNSVTVNVGADFGHIFPIAGTHTVTIKVRQGVNAFRFSTVPPGNVDDWGATFVPNDYIRTIRRIKSDSLTSGYKMFAGCRKASFAPEFVGLETPNMINFNFIFENFGSYGSGLNGAFTVNDNMRFPLNTYQHISPASKAQVTDCTRAYFGSGFEKIEKSMFAFAADNTLVSVFETCRQMKNVGANWTAKYGKPNNASELLAMERFLEMDIFQNQKNIKNYTGCFNAINDFYGNAGPNNYDYPLLLEPDLFLNNEANDIILDWMFNKATRAILASNFFQYLGNGQRIKTMDGCFWNFGLGSPRFSWGEYLPDYWWGSRIDTHPKSLFPESSYPNMTSMIGAFGYWGGGSPYKRSVGSGFQGLWAINESQTWDNQITSPNQYGWTFIMPSVSIAQFLSRFPNVTQTSGTDPRDNETVCDGAAFIFGDWDVPDSANVTRANDFNTYNARTQVKEHVLLN